MLAKGENAAHIPLDIIRYTIVPIAMTKLRGKRISLHLCRGIRSYSSWCLHVNWKIPILTRAFHPNL